MTLIIGCGCPDRGDDAAGRLVARRIGAIEHNGDALGLLECWAANDNVILVDATVTGAAPGTLHWWNAESLRTMRPLLRCSTHSLGPAEAIALAGALGRLPKRLRILGIEGAQFELGSPPSPAVLAAIGEAAQRLRCATMISSDAR